MLQRIQLLLAEAHGSCSGAAGRCADQCSAWAITAWLSGCGADMRMPPAPRDRWGGVAGFQFQQPARGRIRRNSFTSRHRSGACAEAAVTMRQRPRVGQPAVVSQSRMPVRRSARAAGQDRPSKTGSAFAATSHPADETDAAIDESMWSASSDFFSDLARELRDVPARRRSGTSGRLDIPDIEMGRPASLHRDRAQDVGLEVG